MLVDSYILKVEATRCATGLDVQWRQRVNIELCFWSEQLGMWVLRDELGERPGLWNMNQEFYLESITLRYLKWNCHCMYESSVRKKYRLD